MRKLLYIILLLLPCWVFAQQTTPVNPVQVTQQTLYNEPSTGVRWFYNGSALGWYALPQYTPPNSVLTGLGMSVVGSTLTVQSGTWRINSQVYTLSAPTNFTLQAMDPVYSRYEIVYATKANNGIGIKVGALSPTPIQPSFGVDTLTVGSVLITPTQTIIIPPTPSNQYVFSAPTVQQSNANPWVRTLRGDTIKVAGQYTLPSVHGQSGYVLTDNGTGATYWSPQAIYAAGFGLKLIYPNTFISDTTKMVTITALNDTLKKNAAHFNPNQFIIARDTINIDTNKFASAPDLILSGMTTTASGTTATTTAGSYRLLGIIHTIPLTNTTIPAQDATLSRFSVIYATTSGTLGVVNGALATNPDVPSIPANTLLVSTILITPTGVTTQPPPNGKINANNGLTLKNGTIQLGGNLLHSTNIGFSSTAPLTIIDQANNNGVSINSGGFNATYQSGTNTTQVISGKTQALMTIQTGSTQTGITEDYTLGTRVLDGLFSRGMVFGGNYTTNQRLQRLSVPSVGTTIALIDSVKSTISSPVGANPTATAGVSPVNGTATTFMRSDAAPKVDSTVFETVANFFPKGDTRYAKIGGGTLTNTLTFGTGLVAGSYNNSAPVTEKVDTTVMQTIANFFPKGDTRYYKSSNPSGYISANQPITVTATGDATGTSTASGTAPSLPLTLAASGVTAGTYTNATVTVNGKGLVTSASNGSGGGVSSVTSTGTYEPASITGTNINIPNLFGGVWRGLGTIMTSDYTDDQTTLIEPSIIEETVTPYILTNTSGPIYRCWYTSGYTSPNIKYAESLNGVDWVRSDVNCVTGHARSCVMKQGSTYYCFASLGTAGTQIDVYSSSTGNPGSWTLLASGIITQGASGTWNRSVTNCSVIYDGTTWQMLLEGSNNTGSQINSIGYYSSSSPSSGWTAYGSNPVISLSGFGWGGPDLHKIGSTYYAWVHGSGSTSSVLPTEIYRFHSSNLTSWTADNSGNPVYKRTQADEGYGTTVGQVADPFVLDNGTNSYLFFDAVPSGSSNSGSHLKEAVAGYTMPNLVNTNEGNGGYVNTLSGWPFYDKVQSDNNYIPNATNVGSNSTWTTGTILVQDATGFGIRIRDPSTTTTFSALLQGSLYLEPTGNDNHISGGTSAMTLAGHGGFQFLNTGTGTGTLGSFDNTGKLTVAGGLIATTGGVTSPGGALDATVNGVGGAGSTFGLALRNNTAATVGTQQWSPSIYLIGRGWDTGASTSREMDMQNDLETASGNPITGNATWKFQINSGGFANKMTLSNTGDLKTTSSIGSTEITFANAPSSPYTGQICNFSDSTVNTWGATVAGGGTNHVAARYNGTNWTVIGI